MIKLKFDCKKLKIYSTRHKKYCIYYNFGSQKFIKNNTILNIMTPPFQTSGEKPQPFKSSRHTTAGGQSIGGNTQKGGNTNRGGGVGNPTGKTFKPRINKPNNIRSNRK